MKLAVSLVAVIALVRVAAAGDRDPDDDWSPEYSFGIRAPAMMHVGAWRAMDLGFAGTFGMRVDRVAVVVEGDLFALWPTKWDHGSIAAAPGSDQSVFGSGCSSIPGARSPGATPTSRSTI